MTCHCKHEWCWMCGGDWFPVHGSSFYECNVFKKDLEAQAALAATTATSAAATEGGGADADAEDDARLQAKELERKRIETLAIAARYQHYFDRYDLQNMGSTERAATHLRSTVRDKTEDYADRIGLTKLQLSFAETAANRVLAARRALKWSFALLFFMDEDEDGASHLLSTLPLPPVRSRSLASLPLPNCLFMHPRIVYLCVNKQVAAAAVAVRVAVPPSRALPPLTHTLLTHICLPSSSRPDAEPVPAPPVLFAAPC